MFFTLRIKILISIKHVDVRNVDLFSISFRQSLLILVESLKFSFSFLFHHNIKSRKQFSDVGPNRVCMT